ncbi:MAG: ABC transporter substrate-binding protein [Anaerolineaceae bacterium]|nr:ABC transporter substrate-binding protein [Anaerolineaceae bacterium]
MKIYKFVFSFSMIALSISSCTPSATPTPPPTPITVQLSWTHQAQFAGMYAADQNGYYAAEGLAVTFVEGGPNIAPVEKVLDGTAQFGVTNADTLLIARSEGKPVQAIATIFRRSPSVYIALANSGITKPQDFVGKTISLGLKGRPLLNTMMSLLGISTNQYTVVESTPDLTPFYEGEVQVRVVFLTNEVLAAEAAGYKLNIIFLDDYGIHFYSDTLFTTDDLITKDSDLVLRFLRATLKGWTYAVEHPNEVGPLVLHYNPQADATLENEKMIASIPLVSTGEDYIGWMKPEIWSGMQKILREQDTITKPLDVTQVYTLQFLQQIYGKK